MLTTLIFSFLFVLNFGSVKVESVKKEGWENPLDDFFGTGSLLNEDSIAREPRATLKPEVNNVEHIDEHSSTGKDGLPFKRTDANFRGDRKQTADCKEDACKSFFPRFVNIILQAANLQNHKIVEEEEFKVSIDVHVSPNVLNTLQRFGLGETIPYEVLDETFISFFKPDKSSTFSFFSDIVTGSGALFSQYIIEILPVWPLLILSVLISVAIAYVLKHGVTFNTVVGACFAVYYVSCVSLDLWKQYEDVYAQRVLALEETLSNKGKYKIPDDCFPSKLTYWHVIYNAVAGASHCERYLKLKKSIWHEIDLQQAFSKPFYGLIFSFLPDLGDAAGKTVKNYSDYFPWPLNWIVVLALTYCIFTSCIPSIISSSMAAGPSKLYSKYSKITGTRHNSCCDHESITEQAQAPTPPGLTVNYHLHGQMLNLPQTSGMPSTTHSGMLSTEHSRMPSTSHKNSLLSKQMKEQQIQRSIRKKALLYAKKIKDK